jgi:hypothetical protein
MIKISIGGNGGWETLSKELPDKIDEYIFVKLIPQGQGSAKKGIYEERSSGEKVFVKVSNDNSELANEYQNHKVIFDSAKEEVKDVIIPRPLGVKKVNGSTALIMEYFDGSEIVKHLDRDIRLDTTLKAIEFLGRSSKPETLPKLTTFYQLASLPYFLLMNSLTYPKNFLSLLQSFITVLKNGNKWLKLKSDTLNHGDLNSGNIAISKEKVILLDFSKACIGNIYWNMAQMLNSCWEDPDYQTQLRQRLIEKFGFTESDTKILKSFELFNMMQRMCKRYDEPGREEAYFKKIKKLTDEL